MLSMELISENTSLNDIKVNCETLELLQKVHHNIVNSDKNIDFKIFPIYIKYYINLRPVAIIYFKGKFVEKGALDLGINLDSIPAIDGFREAGYMKDVKINFSITINDLNYSDALVKTILGLIK